MSEPVELHSKRFSASPAKANPADLDARAARFKARAAEIRMMAEAEPIPYRRKQSLALADQYVSLAGRLETSSRKAD